MHGFAAIGNVSVFIHSFIFVSEKVSTGKHETVQTKLCSHTPH